MTADVAHIAGPGRPARPAGSTIIKMAGLAKSFGGRVAVEDLSFQVRSGQVTGFLGPNVAGTSTALRLMLQGAGRTTFDGRPNRELAEPAREVGAMLESGAFHPTRTTRNRLRRMAAPCAVPDIRVDEVLDVVGLSSVARKGPGSYSLGRSQRLGLAVALLGDSHDELRGHRALRTPLTLGAVRATPDNVQRQGSSPRSTQLGRMTEGRSACPKKIKSF